MPVNFFTLKATCDLCGAELKDDFGRGPGKLRATICRRWCCDCGDKFIAETTEQG